MLPPHWQRKTPALIVRHRRRVTLARADALEQRLDVLGVRATPQSLSGSAPRASARSCCTCRCTKGYSSCDDCLDDARGGGRTGWRSWGTCGRSTSTFSWASRRSFSRVTAMAIDGVHEALPKAGAAVRRLLVVEAGLDDAGVLEQVLGDHEVLAVADDLVGEDLAVVAGRVRGDLDAVEAPPDEIRDATRGRSRGSPWCGCGGSAPATSSVYSRPTLGQHLVGLGAVLGHRQDVARLLVDGVAGRAEVAHHGVAVLDGDAGVARRQGDRGGHRHELGVVAEAGAAGLLGVDGVLDAEALEEPLGGRLGAGVLGRDQAAAKEQHAAGHGRDVGCGRRHGSLLARGRSPYCE